MQAPRGLDSLSLLGHCAPACPGSHAAGDRGPSSAASIPLSLFFPPCPQSSEVTPVPGVE